MAKMDVQTNNESNSTFAAKKLNINNNNDEPRYLHKKFKKMAVVDSNKPEDPQCSSSQVATEELPAKSEDLSPSSAESRNVCPYCNLSCVKPSVLQKHIRAHTNERPYPCRPCGFAFKTKSNLYKHYRSQSHITKIEGTEPSKVSDDSDQSSSDIENLLSPKTGAHHLASQPIPVYKPKFHKGFDQSTTKTSVAEQTDSRSLLSPGPLLGNTRLVEELTPAAKRTRLHDFSESSDLLTDSSASVDSTSVLVQPSLQSGGTLVCNRVGNDTGEVASSSSPPSTDNASSPVCQIPLSTLLPYKPNLYANKDQQQQLIVASNSDTFLSASSPDTLRPRKSYGQLYLNGHAYTYLGLKCSTRLFYCTLNRPQPMYVAQQHGLSMYSNWKIFKDTMFHSKLDLYDSRQRPNHYTVARSPFADILTHSSKCNERRSYSGSPVTEHDSCDCDKTSNCDLTVKTLTGECSKSDKTGFCQKCNPDKKTSDEDQLLNHSFEAREDPGLRLSRPKIVHNPQHQVKSISENHEEGINESKNNRKIIRSLSEEHEAAQSLLCLAKTDPVYKRQSGLLSHSRPSTYPYGPVDEALKLNLSRTKSPPEQPNPKISHRPYFSETDEKIVEEPAKNLSADPFQPIDLTNKEQQHKKTYYNANYEDLAPQDFSKRRLNSNHSSAEDFYPYGEEVKAPVVASTSRVVPLHQQNSYEPEESRDRNFVDCVRKKDISVINVPAEEKIPKVNQEELQQQLNPQLLSPFKGLETQNHHQHPQQQQQHHHQHPIVVKNSKNSLVSSDKITEHLFPRKVVVGGPEFRPTSPTYAGKLIKTQSDYYSASHMSNPSVISVSDDGRNVCSICNKVFSKPSQLRLHINIHYFERPYRCGSCAVSFRTKGHLTKHERSVSHHNKASMTSTFGAATMSNPRPFKCTDCKIAFRIHGHLAKHLRSKMHIMKLECLGKLPFGTYAEIEKSNINLNNIDTTDCDNSLASLQVMAEKLYEKNPKMKAWSNEMQYSNDLSCGETSSDDGEPIISHSSDKAFQVEAKNA